MKTTTINVQARASDGEWNVRNAFVTKNKLVNAGSMTKAALLAQANRMLQTWHTYQEDRQLRVFNSDDMRQSNEE